MTTSETHKAKMETERMIIDFIDTQITKQNAKLAILPTEDVIGRLYGSDVTGAYRLIRAYVLGMLQYEETAYKGVTQDSVLLPSSGRAVREAEE